MTESAFQSPMLSHELLRAVVETAPIGMAVIRDGKCILANQAFASLRNCGGGTCGICCSAAEFLQGEGLEWSSLVSLVSDHGEVKRFGQIRLDKGQIEDVRFSLRGFHVDGSLHMLLTVQESGDEVRLHRLVKHMAFHDSLTELPNRGLLFDRLSQALARMRREDWGFAFMILDLDEFKEVNDAWGHGMGDEVLYAVGRRLLGCVRESDTVARMGGDEFALLLNGVRGEDEAGQVARKVLSALDQPFGNGLLNKGLGASIGVVLCPHHGLSLDALLAQADRAMYQAKKEGRCCYVLSDGSLDGDGLPMRMPWLNPVVLGDAGLDREHDKLVEQINGLIEAMADGRDQGVLTERLRHFEHLVRSHFSDEERMMEALGWQELAQHREAHQRLLAELPSLVDQVRAGTFTTTVHSLRRWLMDHLRSEDRAFVGFLQGQAD